MIADVRTFVLSGRNDVMEPPIRFFQTIFFSTPTKVTATAALSMVSIGSTQQSAGTAGAVIWKVGIARPGGGATDTVDLSDSFEHNGGTFERCIFVTFALSLRMAAGVGLYTVSIHG
jgi:hypothetical protein